jgi:hypothetical protein
MSPLDTTDHSATARTRKRRWLRRGPWEAASTIVIAAGILMLMQPFALVLYSFSLLVILAGSVGFIITSHFAE